MRKFLADPNLSLEAKGLLSMALDLSETEQISLELFKKNCSDSIQIISKVLKELAIYGYMTRTKNSNGRLYYTYSFYEESLISKHVNYYQADGIMSLPKEQIKTLLPESFFNELWFEVE